MTTTDSHLPVPTIQQDEYLVYVNETLVEGHIWLTPAQARLVDEADPVVRILWSGRTRPAGGVA